MCESCGSVDRSVEITPENRLEMIKEASIVALHAASMYNNDWYRGAQGLHLDMAEKWGEEAHLRMLYVWGAARFFLPEDVVNGPLVNPGYSDLEQMSREMTGEEPDPQHLAHLVAANDQVGACAHAISQAASRGDLAAIRKVVEDITEPVQAAAVCVLLMADAGCRMSHAKATDNQVAMGLFNAHVRAHYAAGEAEDGA